MIIQGQGIQLSQYRGAMPMVIMFWLLLVSFTGSAPAQDDPDSAPPPTKIITREERLRLENERDLKGRTRLYIDLMNTRLGAAEKLSTAEEYNAMIGELGSFEALMDNCIATLLARHASGAKAFDQFKRLDITLRGFGTRLEMIRRDLPLRFENYMLSLMRAVRDTRSKAVDPLFGNTVLPNASPDQ